MTNKAPTPAEAVTILRSDLTDELIDHACYGLGFRDFDTAVKYDRAIVRKVFDLLAATAPVAAIQPAAPVQHEASAGTPEARLNWLLGALRERFPSAADIFSSEPAEPKLIAAIDTALATREAKAEAAPVGEVLSNANGCWGALTGDLPAGAKLYTATPPASVSQDKADAAPEHVSSYTYRDERGIICQVNAFTEATMQAYMDASQEIAEPPPATVSNPTAGVSIGDDLDFVELARLYRHNPTRDSYRALCAYIDARRAPAVGMVAAKDNAVHQAQTWAMEAKTQRDIVRSILRYFGLPEQDWNALKLIQEKFATPDLSEASMVAAPDDPMDWPLPCDVTVGSGTIKKGCTLRTLVARMGVMNDMIREGWSSAPAAPDLSVRDAARLDWIFNHVTVAQLVDWTGVPLPDDPALRNLSAWGRESIDAALRSAAPSTDTGAAS